MSLNGPSSFPAHRRSVVAARGPIARQ